MADIDPYYFLLDGVGYPDDFRHVEMPDTFAVYLLSNGKTKAKIFIYLDRKEFALSSKQDDKSVVRLFTQLIRKLASCNQANEIFGLYDTKELHPALCVKIKHQSEPVYRIRKDSLRLYFVIIGADMILFRLSTKRQDKLPPTEKNLIEKRVQAIFAHQIEQRVIQ